MKVKITEQGVGSFEVESGTRLVLALEDNGVDVLHRCGGYAHCTTCRVEFEAGEPSRMTEAEKVKLAETGVPNIRLSCQIVCDHEMSVNAISTLTSSGLDDPGQRPEPQITPEAVWTTK